MVEAIIAFISTLLGAVITGVFMYLSYGRTSKATLKSSSIADRVNTKNTLIAQYNNLFERVSELEDEKDKDNQDMENSLQDRVALFFEAKSLILLLTKNGIHIPDETKRVMKNYGNKLRQDSRNSL